jgi:hypothetical protein
VSEWVAEVSTRLVVATPGGRLARTIGVLVGDIRRGLSLLLGVGAGGRGLRGLRVGVSEVSVSEREGGRGREGKGVTYGEAAG